MHRVRHECGLLCCDASLDDCLLCDAVVRVFLLLIVHDVAGKHRDSLAVSVVLETRLQGDDEALLVILLTELEAREQGIDHKKLLTVALVKQSGVHSDLCCAHDLDDHVLAELVTSLLDVVDQGCEGGGFDRIRHVCLVVSGHVLGAVCSAIDF